MAPFFRLHHNAKAHYPTAFSDFQDLRLKFINCQPMPQPLPG